MAEPKTKTIPPEREGLFVQKGILSSLLRLLLLFLFRHTLDFVNERSEFTKS